MANSKTPPDEHLRFSSVAEIRQHIAKLAERIEQVQELTREGLPYADALRVKVDHGIRGTLREIFGTGSSECEAYQHLAIDASGHPTIARTVTMLQELIAFLEDQEAVLLGQPRPPRPPKLPPAPPPALPMPAASPAPADPPATPSPRAPEARGRRAAGPERPAPPPRTSASQPGLAEALGRIRTICLRFHAVVRQLRDRSEGRHPFEVEDEHDVRDLLRALLQLEFDEVQMEQVDLIVPAVGVAIVATKTRRGVGAKEIGDFWTAAARRYAGREGCKSLFGFVYDPEGRIGTPRRLEADLQGIETHGKGEVHVLPK